MQGRYNIFFCWNPNSQLWSLNRTHPLTCCNLRPRKALLQLQIEGATNPEIESILQVAQSRQQSVYLLHHITLPLEQQFENSVQVEHSTQLCSTLDTLPKQHHYRQGCSLAQSRRGNDRLNTNVIAHQPSLPLSRPPSRQAQSVTSKLRLSQAGKSKIFGHILTVCPPAPNPNFFILVNHLSLWFG